jgi:hypothetical protein
MHTYKVLQCGLHYHLHGEFVEGCLFLSKIYKEKAKNWRHIPLLMFRDLNMFKLTIISAYYGFYYGWSTWHDPHDMSGELDSSTKFFVEHPIELWRAWGRKRNTMHYVVLTYNLKSEK